MNKVLLRITSLIVTLSLMLTTFLNVNAAVTLSAGEISGMRVLFATENGRGNSLCSSDSATIDNFIREDAIKLKSNGTELFTVDNSSNKYYINMYVWKKYEIITYGERSGDTKRVNGFTEYRYIGWTIGHAARITNDRFPYDDPVSSTIDPRTRNWRNIEAASASWKSITEKTELMNYILFGTGFGSSPTLNVTNGSKLPYNMKDILQTATDGSSSPNDLMPKILVQAAPDNLSNGSLHLEFKASNGSIRYDTFIIDKLPGVNVSFSMIASDVANVTAGNAKTSFTMKETQDYIDVYYKATATFSWVKAPPNRQVEDAVNYVAMKAAHLVNGAMVQHSVSLPSSTATFTFQKRFYRSNLDVGSNSSTLSAVASVGTIYRGAKDPEYHPTATKNITIKVLQVDPKLTVEADASPDTISSDGSRSENTTITGDFNLTGYADKNNISSIKLQMAYSGTATQEYTLPTINMSGSHAFDLTIPASHFNSAPINKKAKVTVVVTFKNKIWTPSGQVSSSENSQYVTISLKKPSSSPMPPTLGIDGSPSTVYLGGNYNIKNKCEYFFPASSITSIVAKEKSPSGSIRNITLPSDLFKTNGYTPSQLGQYTYTITSATDNKGLTTTGEETVIINVIQATPTPGPDDTPEPPAITPTPIIPVYTPAPTAVPNKPPHAVLDVHSECMEGEDVFVSGLRSYDTDGTIVDYYFTITGANGTISGGSGLIWYPEVGTYTITLIVTDDDGAGDMASQSIVVSEAKPTAAIGITGTQKENRKVTISSLSSSPSRFPITSKQFTIKDSNGQVAGTSLVKYNGSLNLTTNDTLFKVAGNYTIDLTVTNSRGNSSSTSRTITISADEKPVASFATINKVYRDQTSTFKYDYGQNLSWTYHGFQLNVDTNKKYVYSMDIFISSDANMPNTGLTFVADLEQGLGTAFAYDNTKKGTWQHFEFVGTPTQTTVLPLMYPIAFDAASNINPNYYRNPTKGHIIYSNVQFREVGTTANMFPQALTNEDFTVRGNGTFECNTLKEYKYEYSQNLAWQPHGFSIPVSTSKQYIYSMDAFIPITANTANTGSTFIANTEGTWTHFAYDNTKKGTWQHFETVFTPTTVTLPVHLYPVAWLGDSANPDPNFYTQATSGYIKYANVQFREVGTSTNLFSQPNTDAEFQTNYSGIMECASTRRNAVVKLTDTSMSIDGDTISHRTWKYYFDSDNDGDFSDETPFIFSDTNETEPILYLPDVGKYRFELEVTESFGQTTIPDLVSASDYKKGDTTTQDSETKTVEVANLAPTVDFQTIRKKKVDLTISIGNTSKNNITDLTNKINTLLKPELTIKNIDLNVNFQNTVVNTGSTFSPKNLYFAFYNYEYPNYSTINSGGVAKYNEDTGQFTVVKNLPSAYGIIRMLLVGQDGTIYGVAGYNNYDYILFRLDPTSGSISNILVSTPSLGIKAIFPAEDGSGDILFVTRSTNNDEVRLYRYSRTSFTYSLICTILPPVVGYYYIPDRFSSACQLPDGSIYYAIESGVYKIPSSGGPAIKIASAYLTCQNFATMGYTTDGFLYIPSYQGLYRLNLGTNYLELCPNNDTYPNNNVDGYQYARQNEETSNSPRTDMVIGSVKVFTQGNRVFVQTRVYGSNTDFAYEYLNNGLKSLPFQFPGHGYHYILATIPNGNMYFAGGQSGIYKNRYDNPIANYGNGINFSSLFPTNSFVDAAVFSPNGSHIFGTWNRVPTYYPHSYLPPTTTKELQTAIPEATWRADAEKFYLNIADLALPELNDPKKKAQAASTLQNKAARFVGFGNGNNVVQFNSLILDNSNKGIYLDNTNIDNAFISLKDYIKAEMEEQPTEVYDTILLNDNLEFQTFYKDTENDPENATQWKYEHFGAYFDNSQGTIDNNNTWVNSSLTSYTKPGKYFVSVRKQDNPKNDVRFNGYKLWSDVSLTKKVVYVHRKPIAVFTVNFTGKDGSGNYISSVEDTSYDLDHTSRSDKGLVDKKWQWKASTWNWWSDGSLPTVLAPNATYLVKLTVQDMEGAWSDPCVVTVTTEGGNFAPTVDANPQSLAWTNAANTNVVVTASDPDNNFSYQKAVWSSTPEKPTAWWTTSDAVFTTYAQAEGIWWLHMVAVDLLGLEFYRMRGPYNIDRTAPYSVYSITNPPAWTNQDITVDVTPYDTASGIYEAWYCTSSNDGVLYGAWDGPNPDIKKTFTFTTEGVHKIRCDTYDYAGNWNRNDSTYFRIDKTNPNVDCTPTSNSSNSNIAINVTASDSGGSGVKDVKYKLTSSTGKPTSGWTTTTSTNFNVVASSEGKWYLHMEVTDNAGNTFYQYRGIFLIDKTNPSGTFSISSPPAWTNQDTNLDFTPVDALSGVKEWRFKTSSNDGATYGAWSALIGDITSTISFITEGTHRAMVEVWDNVTNYSSQVSTYFRIDKTDPTVDCNPMNGDSITPITITVTASDTGGSGVKNVKYLLTYDTSRPASGWTTTTNTSFNVPINTDGTWYLHMLVTDNAGNDYYRYRGPFIKQTLAASGFKLIMMFDAGWRSYYFDTAHGIDDNGDGKIDRYPKYSNRDIFTTQLPVNSLGLIAHGQDHIKAGYKVKGSIVIVGNPDTAKFIATYKENNLTKTADIPLTLGSSNTYSFEWVIPIDTDNDSYVKFDLAATKGATNYGNERWTDTWAAGNGAHNMFYVKGTALDDLIVLQSQ